MSAHLFVLKSVPKLSRDCPRWMNAVLTVHFFACNSRCSLFLHSPTHSRQLRATSPRHDSTSYTPFLTPRLYVAPHCDRKYCVPREQPRRCSRVALALHRPLRTSRASACVFMTTLYHHHALCLGQTRPAVLLTAPLIHYRSLSRTRQHPYTQTIQ